MKSWPWLGIAACVVSASTWAAQMPAVMTPVSTARLASANATQVQRRLLQREAEVARLQQAVKRQESHSQQAGEQLRQRDAEILKLQAQLQTMPKTTAVAGP